jgi:hypothetical protein
MSTPPYSSWKMQPLQPSLPTLEISVALFTVICLWLLARRRQAPLSFPTVPGWPLLGSLIELGSPSRLYEQLTAWAKVHGEAEGAWRIGRSNCAVRHCSARPCPSRDCSLQKATSGG